MHKRIGQLATVPSVTCPPDLQRLNGREVKGYFNAARLLQRMLQ